MVKNCGVSDGRSGVGRDSSTFSGTRLDPVSQTRVLTLRLSLAVPHIFVAPLLTKY